jgi:hypothetical protein
MSAHRLTPRATGRLTRHAWFLLLGLAGAAGADLPARAASLEPRVPAGTCRSAAGTLLYQEDPGQAWRVVAAGEGVRSRDLLLALPGVRAEVEPRPGSVALTLWGNLPQLSPFPVLESAAALHDSRAFDLDLTLVRGRVTIANRKASGPARLWVRILDGAGEVTLPAPGDEVAFEVYGRWPRGTSFSRQPGPRDRPTTVFVVLALKGQVDLKAGGIQHRLTAPPGPAAFHWDSVAGPAEGPERREQLPPWADPAAPAPPEAGLVRQVVARYQEAVASRSPRDALLDLLAGADRDSDASRARVQREFAVLGLTALGDVERVAEALADGHNAAVRDTAVIGLRHYIGEAPGRDQQLYRLLIDRLHYSAAQAETILQLLHSPFAADQPETYETLIAYLYHKKLAIRTLALWHLTRLVPGGAAIAYDPAAPEAERARAAAEWKKLIPSGQLPQKGSSSK